MILADPERRPTCICSNAFDSMLRRQQVDARELAGSSFDSGYLPALPQKAFAAETAHPGKYRPPRSGH
jgi:hypothetical protein